MDVIPPIRTPREDARAPSRDGTSTWEGTYETYLKSSAWRSKRDAALRRAGWKCQRCSAQRGVSLQVHHKTYERLGNELDTDLEVLCLTCHEGHHINEHQQIRGVYVAVVSSVLKVERFTCMADLMEAVKVECAKSKIPYDGRKIWRAVSLVDANRQGVIDAPKRRLTPILEQTQAQLGRPATKEEALDFFRTIGFNVNERAMPAIERDDYARDMERANRIRQQAAEMLKSKP